MTLKELRKHFGIMENDNVYKLLGKELLQKRIEFKKQNGGDKKQFIFPKDVDGLVSIYPRTILQFDRNKNKK